MSEWSEQRVAVAQTFDRKEESLVHGKARFAQSGDLVAELVSVMGAA